MAEITKEKILASADSLFSKNGVREVSIDDICRKLCISKKTFYQFYPQKEDLVGAIVSYHIDKTKSEFEKLSDSNNLMRAMKTLFDMVGKKKTMNSDKRMAYEIKKYYPETFRKNAREQECMMKEYFIAVFDEGAKEGYFRTDINRDASLLLCFLLHKGMVDYMENGQVAEGRKITFKKLAKSYEDIITRSLLTEKGYKEYFAQDKKDNSKK